MDRPTRFSRTWPGIVLLSSLAPAAVAAVLWIGTPASVRDLEVERSGAAAAELLRSFINAQDGTELVEGKSPDQDLPSIRYSSDRPECEFEAPLEIAADLEEMGLGRWVRACGRQAPAPTALAEP